MTRRKRKGSAQDQGVTQRWCFTCRVWTHSDEPPHECEGEK